MYISEINFSDPEWSRHHFVGLQIGITQIILSWIENVLGIQVQYKLCDFKGVIIFKANVSNKAKSNTTCKIVNMMLYKLCGV